RQLMGVRFVSAADGAAPTAVSGRTSAGQHRWHSGPRPQLKPSVIRWYSAPSPRTQGAVAFGAEPVGPEAPSTGPLTPLAPLTWQALPVLCESSRFRKPTGSCTATSKGECDEFSAGIVRPGSAAVGQGRGSGRDRLVRFG